MKKAILTLGALAIGCGLPVEQHNNAHSEEVRYDNQMHSVTDLNGDGIVDVMSGHHLTDPGYGMGNLLTICHYNPAFDLGDKDKMIQAGRLRLHYFTNHAQPFSEQEQRTIQRKYELGQLPTPENFSF